MFQNTNIFVQILGVLLSLITAAAVMYMMVKAAERFGLTKDIFTLLAAFSFSILVSVFFIDSVLAYHTDLLKENERLGIFELTKQLILLIAGYYFGSKSKGNDKIQ